MKNSDPDELSCFLVVAGTKAVTIKSPEDGEESLVTCWTEAAAEKVARRRPAAVVVEATPEMFLKAIREAHKMRISWLYHGNELRDGVVFTKVRIEAKGGA